MPHRNTVRRNESRQIGTAGEPPILPSLVGRWVAGALNGLQGGAGGIANGGGVPAPLPENGAAVASWVAVYGNTSPFAQATPGNRPTFFRPNNGAPAAVRFAATKTLASAVSLPIAGEARTMFLIGTNWTTTASQRLLAYGTMGTTLQGFGLSVNADTPPHLAYDVGTGTGGSKNTPLVPPATPLVLMLSFDGTNALFQAGDQARTAEARVLNTVASLALTLGGTNSAFDAYEVLMYSAALSDAQIDAVGGYATARYGAPRLL